MLVFGKPNYHVTSQSFNQDITLGKVYSIMVRQGSFKFCVLATFLVRGKDYSEIK